MIAFDIDGTLTREWWTEDHPAVKRWRDFYCSDSVLIPDGKAYQDFVKYFENLELIRVPTPTEYFLITSRPLWLRPVTKVWAEKNQLNHIEIITPDRMLRTLPERAEFKASAISRFKVRCYVEDEPVLAASLNNILLGTVKIIDVSTAIEEEFLEVVK